MNLSSRSLRPLRTVLVGEKGITGLETAIVLIAFVVVSSVFAFAALSTGMFSSDKARETVNAGLAQTRATRTRRWTSCARPVTWPSRRETEKPYPGSRRCWLPYLQVGKSCLNE